MIYTRQGSPCTILSGDMEAGTVNIQIEDGDIFNTYVHELRADGGIQEIEKEIKAIDLKFTDIRLISEEEKFAQYEQIGMKTEGLTVVEHVSGFPAIMVSRHDKNIHIITDHLSVEKWFRLKTGGTNEA